jgi:hypothetical protein
VRKTGKRGYCYDCKECRKEKNALKTESASEASLEQVEPVPSAPTTASICPPDLVMMAIENSPSFEHVMEIVEYTNGQLNYDALFKLVATKFPANYMDLFTKLQKAPVSQVGTQTEPQEEVVNDIEALKQEPTPQYYKEQFKNDPNMTFVGQDIESDDEHTTWPVRCGNEWRLIKVKR